MPAELATPGFLKTKYLEITGSDVTTSFHDATHKNLSRSSNYIVDVVMWPNFADSSIFMREVIITQIVSEIQISEIFDQKTRFFLGVVLVQV